jgi:ferritin-like metal-binding protein YciE
MEALFKSIKKKAIGKKCVALDLIMEEAYESIASSDDCMIRDAEIISALQKLNYYEIEACNKASQFAEALGYNEAVRMLQISQQEESAIDNRIGQIVLNTINVAVMEEVLSFD